LVQENTVAFKDSVLESVAKKIESFLNPNFDKVVIRGLLALGTALIAASYGMSVAGKAEIKTDIVSPVFDLSTGPSLVFLVSGGVCIAIAIMLHWKTMVVAAGGARSDFEGLVRAGVDEVHDYLLQKAFEREHRYLAGSDVIKFMLGLKDPLFVMADYKKARSHVHVDEGEFKLVSAKKLGLISILSILFYVGGALLALLMLQVALFAFRNGIDSLDVYCSLGVVGASFAMVSFFSLRTYGETAAARRLTGSEKRTPPVAQPQATE